MPNNLTTTGLGIAGAEVITVDWPSEEEYSPSVAGVLQAKVQELICRRRGSPEAWEGLGEYGLGTHSEVDGALGDVLAALEGYGRTLLEGGEPEWTRLQAIAADLVRRAASAE